MTRRTKAKASSVNSKPAHVGEPARAGEPAVVAEASMVGFFHKEIESAVESQGVKLSAHTKSYVVNLLSQYSQASAMHTKEDDTLAMLYLRSQQVAPEERVRMLRRLGDLALCVSGWFADSLNRKVVDVDYYISMGGGAYGTLASIFEQKRDATVFVELYDELARKFPKVVEVLNEVSEGTGSRDASMLRLYDRWMKTGSDRMHRILCERGIVPNRTIKTTPQ
jgi:hypothetical protein